MTHIVKRKGHKQQFDERKVYGSIFAACLSAHCKEEEAEATANLVSREIVRWIADQKEVSSDQIFEKVGGELEHLNKDAAFMYTTHRDVS